MVKRIGSKEVVKNIKDGSVIMVGGFLGSGTPHKIIDALIETGVKDLILIVNDTAFVDYGVGKLIANKQIKKVITSHIGTNKETGRQMNEGTLEVELVPQGNLAEKVRAGGAGLGGVLTPTGVGTLVEEGKEKINIEGKDYLLELPLRADFALIAASKVDKKGNCYFSNTTRNFNPLMALSGDTVIVEAKEIVEIGDITPDLVMVPGEVVDYIVGGE